MVRSEEQIDVRMGRTSSRRVRAVRCGLAEPTGKPAPMGEITRYNDSLFDKASMALFGAKMRQITGLTYNFMWVSTSRYLENSGCVGMCVNMCKIPTQDFFTNDFGLPLTMTPNFDDMSCEMVYGQKPLPLEEDTALKQPCHASLCSMAPPKSTACPRLPNVSPEFSLGTIGEPHSCN